MLATACARSRISRAQSRLVFEGFSHEPILRRLTKNGGVFGLDGLGGWLAHQTFASTQDASSLLLPPLSSPSPRIPSNPKTAPGAVSGSCWWRRKAGRLQSPKSLPQSKTLEAHNSEALRARRALIPFKEGGRVAQSSVRLVAGRLRSTFSASNAPAQKSERLCPLHPIFEASLVGFTGFTVLFAVLGGFVGFRGVLLCAGTSTRQSPNPKTASAKRLNSNRSTLN